MGQSQSLKCYERQNPLQPDRIFGLIYFQQKYNNVTIDPTCDIEKQYNGKRNKWVTQQKISDPELKDMKHDQWKNIKLPELNKRFDDE